jgi:hypothetical protein
MPFKISQKKYAVINSQRTDQDINDLIIQHMGKVPGLTRAFVQKLARERRTKILARLQNMPPPPNYPIGQFPWKSEKQRIYVIIKLKSENNFPYTRTGNLVKRWKVSVTFTQKDAGGEVILQNDSPVGQFVFGIHQQPFHAGRWERSRDVAADEANAFEEDLASAYVTLSDPYAGVRSGL